MLIIVVGDTLGISFLLFEIYFNTKGNQLEEMTKQVWRLKGGKEGIWIGLLGWVIMGGCGAQTVLKREVVK